MANLISIDELREQIAEWKDADDSNDEEITIEDVLKEDCYQDLQHFHEFFTETFKEDTQLQQEVLKQFTILVSHIMQDSIEFGFSMAQQ